MRKFLATILAAAVFGLAASGAQAEADKVRISFNPLIYSYLPLFLAVDKGYFKEQNIDVDVVTYGGSALSQIPMLARGDQDIAGMVTGPGFFNQKAEGFGVKLIASLAQAKKGWHDTMWMMVRKDVWDTGKIKTYADMKGHVIEGGPKGSPVYLTSTQAMVQGGLTTKDVTFTERLRAVSDALPIFRNKAADIITMVEPICSRMVEEGIAVRWKPSYEVMPWFQESYLAANPKFLTEKRAVTKRFLLAYFKGLKEVTDGHGKWSPDMIASVVKWSKMPKNVIEGIPGPQNVSQMGLIDTNSIARQQEIWMKAGLVKEKTPIKELVDTSIVDEVRAELKIK
ncbi:MAG: ABC transporter substrate-binding protein [Candidatus Eiseniibacteriota bacterium]